MGPSATAGNATKDVTISCKNWRNPVTPTEAAGFYISSRDFSGREMELSSSFSLDASAFSPYAITDADVAVSLGDTKVQQKTSYMFTFTSPVPLEVDTAGCFIKFIFPADFIFTDADFSTFVGDYQMRQAGGSTAQALVEGTTASGGSGLTRA